MNKDIHWTITRRRAFGLTFLATLITCAGFAAFLAWQRHFSAKQDTAFASMWAYAFDDKTPIFSGLAAICGYMMPGLGIYVLLLMAHEACHGFGFLWAGGKPRYGFKLVQWYMPVFYATAPELQLSRFQYLVISLLPTVVLNTVGLIVLTLLPNTGSALPISLSFHLGGCAGDWWVAVAILRLPPQTRFADAAEGFRYSIKEENTSLVLL